MHTGQRQSSHHGCGSQSSGPEVYYGYCHDTRRMRMMNYNDYVNNAQTTYSNLTSNPSSAMQMVLDALSGMAGSTSTTTSTTVPTHHKHHKQGCGCGCHEQDCACECCIRCADVIEYARCGEVRHIPVVFDNDTRRERDVTLQLGNFATESGQDAGWKAAVSPTNFKLPPCGETTVVLSVNVDCSKLGAQTAAGEKRQTATIDSCKVVYATLKAEGCTIRPLVIAVAVLPGFCGAHRAGCGCGCCN